MSPHIEIGPRGVAGIGSTRRPRDEDTLTPLVDDVLAGTHGAFDALVAALNTLPPADLSRLLRRAKIMSLAAEAAILLRSTEAGR